MDDIEGVNKKYPSFQFYPNDFMMDSKVVAMPTLACGMYIKLLCYDWMNDGILNDILVIQKLSGLEIHLIDDDIEIDMLFKHVRDCFVFHPDKPGHITNPRLYKDRKRLEDNHLAKVANGRKGGDAKAKAQQASSEALANPSKGVAKSSTSVSVSSSVSTSITKDKDLKTLVVLENEKWFEEDWKSYPKGGNKKRAKVHYLKTVKTEADREEFIFKTSIYLSGVDDPTYYKNGDTWFCNWDTHEVKATAPRKTKGQKLQEDRFSGLKTAMEKIEREENSNGKENTSQRINIFDRKQLNSGTK